MSEERIIRINKVLRELNISLERAVDYLKDKGIDVELIAIDGKTVRGSKDTFHEKSAIHLINAWASQNQLVLGQCKSEGKSNEIESIPVLLDLLDIKDSLKEELEKSSTGLDIHRKIPDGIIRDL